MLTSVYELDKIIKSLERICYNIEDKNQHLLMDDDKEIPLVDTDEIKKLIAGLEALSAHLLHHPLYEKEREESYL